MAVNNELATRLAAAVEEVGVADQSLAQLLRELTVAPRAEKTAISDTVRDALARLKLATSNLIAVQKLVDDEEG